MNPFSPYGKFESPPQVVRRRRRPIASDVPEFDFNAPPGESPPVALDPEAVKEPQALFPMPANHASSTKPLPCPFCGSEAVARWDGPEARPFYVRCSVATCPGHNTSTTYAEADVAMHHWQRRAQMPPANPFSVYCLGGFATKNLIRGELVHFELDRTGVLSSDSFRFDPHSRPLMLKPRDVEAR